MRILKIPNFARIISLVPLAALFLLTGCPQNENPNIINYVRDHLGNAVTIVDGQGAVTHRIAYSPYGEIISMRNGDGSEELDPLASGIKYLFTEQYFDSDSGLYYMNARYYDPKVRRFLSRDPIMHGGSSGVSQNRHAYVGGRPTVTTDPTGAYEDTGFRFFDDPGVAGNGSVTTNSAVDIGENWYQTLIDGDNADEAIDGSSSFSFFGSSITAAEEHLRSVVAVWLHGSEQAAKDSIMGNFNRDFGNSHIMKDSVVRKAVDKADFTYSLGPIAGYARAISGGGTTKIGPDGRSRYEPFGFRVKIGVTFGGSAVILAHEAGHAYFRSLDHQGFGTPPGALEHFAVHGFATGNIFDGIQHYSNTFDSSRHIVSSIGVMDTQAGWFIGSSALAGP